MKRLAIATLALFVVVLGVWLWWQPAKVIQGPEGASASEPGGASPAPDVRLPAILNAVMNAPLPAPRGDLRIRGKVLGAQGPVAGAAVIATIAKGEEALSEMACRCDNRCGRMLLECGCGDAARQMVDLVAERRGEAQPVARALSAADGTYELAGLEQATVTLWAERDGAGIGIRKDAHPGDEGADLTIDEGMAITGQIRDESDKPIAGALVTAAYSLHSRFFDALTSADGSFRLSPIPRGEFRLVASAEGFLPGNDSATEGDREVKLELQRPRTLAGKVVRGEVPVERARVEAYGQHRRLAAQSDGEGRFLISGLRPGSYQVSAREGLSGAESEVTLKADRADLVLALDALSAFEGDVRDDSGAPVTTAEVRVTKADRYGGDRSPRPVDSAGHFRTDVSGAGEYELVATARGFVEERAERSVGVGASQRVDFVLRRAAALRGRVTNQEGTPVASARVDAAPDFSSLPRGMRGSSQSGKSDADGGFEVDGLAPGEHQVTLSHPDFLDWKEKITIPAEGLRIVLATGAEIAGVVVDATEVPQRDVMVSVTAGPGEDEDEGGRYARSAMTDAQGRFSVKGAPEGRLTATAVQRFEGELAGQTRSATAEVVARKGAAVPTRIRFSGSLSISGVVRTSAGKPVASAAVSAIAAREGDRGPGLDPVLHERPAAVASARSGEDGTFALRYLEPGQYELVASKKGHLPPKVPAAAKAGQTGAVVTLNPLGTVTGRVVDERGAPIAQFEVNRRPMSDPGGAFELPAWKSAELPLVFKAEGYAPEYRTAKAVIGEVVSLPDVVLARGRTLRGRVVDAATGAPLGKSLVDAGQVKDLTAESLYLSTRLGAVETAPDGTFTLPNVPQGQVLLVIQESRHREGRLIVEASQNEVLVKLDSGASIAGKVVNASGSPVVGATVFARSGRNSNRTEVKEDGSYSVTGLAPGSYVVSVRPGRGAQFFPRKAEVGASGTVRIDFAAPKEAATLTLRLPAPPAGYPQIPLLIPGEVPTPASFKEWSAGDGALEGDREKGSFVFRGLPPARYTLFVMRPRPDAIAIHRQVVDLTPGEHQLEVQIPEKLPTIQLDPSMLGAPGD